MKKSESDHNLSEELQAIFVKNTSKNEAKITLSSLEHYFHLNTNSSSSPPIISTPSPINRNHNMRFFEELVHISILDPSISNVLIPFINFMCKEYKNEIIITKSESLYDILFDYNSVFSVSFNKKIIDKFNNSDKENLFFEYVSIFNKINDELIYYVKDTTIEHIDISIIVKYFVKINLNNIRKLYIPKTSNNIFENIFFRVKSDLISCYKNTQCFGNESEVWLGKKETKDIENKLNILCMDMINIIWIDNSFYVIVKMAKDVTTVTRMNGNLNDANNKTILRTNYSKINHYMTIVQELKRNFRESIDLLFETIYCYI